MSDLLSAASLFLAVLGLLYSAWYAEITEALNLKAPDHVEDRKPVIRRVTDAYHTRALPLAVGATCVSIILLPDLVRSLSSSWRQYRDYGVGAIASYDAVQTLFCAICAMTFGFALHGCSLARRLKARIAELRRP